MSKFAIIAGITIVATCAGTGAFAYSQTRTPEPDKDAYVRTVREELPIGWKLTYDGALSLAGDTCKELGVGTEYERLVLLRTSAGESEQDARVVIRAAAEYLCPEHAGLGE